jgi:hypothetical protein
MTNWPKYASFTEYATALLRYSVCWSVCPFALYITGNPKEFPNITVHYWFSRLAQLILCLSVVLLCNREKKKKSQVKQNEFYQGTLYLIEKSPFTPIVPPMGNAMSTQGRCGPFDCPFTLPGTSKLGVEQTALSTLKLLPGKLKDP